MNQPLDKAVTIRFSRGDYLQLQQHAEDQQCSVADMVRTAWHQFQQQQQMEQRLTEQERRLCKAMFAITALGLQLKPEERKQMAQQLQQMGVKW